MCGILSLVQRQGATWSSTASLVRATRRVRHRGPDDAGYLLWSPGTAPRVFADADTARDSRETHGLADLPPAAEWRVAFGHRRLSIVDLTPAGHQPMVHAATGLAVAYNGEIYNHIELRQELERLGHRFRSHCDTEVLLAAWAQWGPACVERLNGMFAFVMLDPRGSGTLYAVRDRFGVKPLYWSRVGGLLAFASEIKQLRALPGYEFRVDERAAYDYLARSLLDHTHATLHEGVQQLVGGEMAIVSLNGDAAPETRRWYELRARPFQGTAADAAEQFRSLFTDSVRLRLRADVSVGSCLSGGLDSSAIVCLAREVLEEQGEHQGQVTVTARFAEARFDEWRFAEQVIAKSAARAVEVWPSVERLQRELDLQLWHLDDPFGSTSQFSQWCVFSAAAEAGLKVMLDGQGSDEQLAGYRGNETALYAGLMRRARALSLLREVRAFHRQHGIVPVAQLILALRNVAPAVDHLLPGRLRAQPTAPDWLRLEAASLHEAAPARDLNAGLREQTLATSLPVLLRYEDRNSMAWSIESRVPFLDYRFVEFVAGLDPSMKYREGVTKVVMREAMDGVLPAAVRDRRDKMGFVTPEEVWVTQTAREWFRESVAAAAEVAPNVLDRDRALAAFDAIASRRAPFSFDPWRMLCFGRWLVTTSADAGTTAPDPAAYQSSAA